MHHPRKLLVSGVMGNPVSHSLSPEIFSSIAKHLGTRAVYKKLEVQSHSFAETVRTLRALPVLDGWNVTIPYKITTAEQMDELSEDARILGAVNVVQRLDGRLVGHNTDVIGIQETLDACGFLGDGASTLLLGAGGAAAAVAFVLGKKNAKKIWIANRSETNARRLADRFNHYFSKNIYEVLPWSGVSTSSGNDLVVNATPVGMLGYSDVNLPLPLEHTDALAFDLIYRPRETLFLKKAEQMGLRTVGGLDMLVWQAIAAWEIWMGPLQDIDRKILKEKIIHEL